MDGGLTMTLVSVAMFLGTFILGFIPLLFTLSEKSLQLLSTLGAGLLCGAALSITIPEGLALLEDSLTASPPSSSSLSSDGPPALNSSERSSAAGSSTPRFLIGVALTLGFTFMFIVDQIGKYFFSNQTSRHSNKAHITATLGLVIHAAADGFALGAAVATGQMTVQIIIFLAVILHKAPAALGLVSFLMHAGLHKKYIQGHLLTFAAAAPVVAMVTYFVLHASGSSAQKQLSATGVGMLFSGGTFLYVATVHVLPEVSSNRNKTPSYSEFQEEDSVVEIHQQQHHMGLLESITLILGVGLPMMLALSLHDD